MFSQESTHGEQFRQDLIQNIERNVGLDTIMRLRTSTGKVFCCGWRILSTKYKYVLSKRTFELYNKLLDR